MQSFGRKLKFAAGVLLALWPVVVAAFAPADVLAGFDLNVLSMNRQPLAVFCIAALVSEVLAVVLFFPSRAFPKGSLRSWSLAAAVAAGACTLAFLIAAVANFMHAL
jgi:hypothetical protein